MFRLAGNSRRDITWLAHTLKSPDGFLVALWLSHDRNPSIPSKSFAIGPLKRLVCDWGHLRLGYWQGNETAKGRSLPVDLRNAEYAHPSESMKTARDTVNIQAPDAIEISASRNGGIVLLDILPDRDKGFIMEGNIRACDNRGYIATHQHAAAAGFFFESEPSVGIAMIPDTLGVTRTGLLRYADRKITDFDIYANAGNDLVESRSGPLTGTLSFDFDDTVGPFGHASFCGIRHNKKHRFRIIARGDYFELYIDDLYVQTYLLPETMSGRIGLICFDGVCEYSEIRMWEMNL
jgi:hypothetical protein